MRPNRGADQGSNSQVRYIVIVHHIDMDQIRAGHLHRTHLLTQARKIGRQNARCDAVLLGSLLQCRLGHGEFSLSLTMS